MASVRSNRKLAVGGGLCLFLFAATGCGNALRDENQALMMENAELRERNGQLEASLSNTESQKASLEAEVARLRSDLLARGTQTNQPRGGSGFDAFGSDVTVGTRGGDIVVSVAGDVLFDSGKVALKPASRQTLDNIASAIQRQHPNKLIRVEGYTDTDPIRKSQWKTNERLSAERALAVEEYLVSKGIRNDRIYAAAFGPANPRSTKRESRRVEIVILESSR